MAFGCFAAAPSSVSISSTAPGPTARRPPTRSSVNPSKDGTSSSPPRAGVDKPAPGTILVDGSRDSLLRQIDKALVNLRRDRIDLFQLHRIDPETPVEVSVAALAEAQGDGRIGHIGLSNVNGEDLKRALSVAPIASVQNRFNMAEVEADDLVDATAERGIAFIPYGPLGANPMKPGATLRPRQALAWLLKRSPNIIVIPGTTSIAHLEENWRAWEEVDRLDREPVR